MNTIKEEKLIRDLTLLLLWLIATFIIGRKLSLPFYYYWTILIPTVIFFLKKIWLQTKEFVSEGDANVQQQ